MPERYWLMKVEPESYSIDEFERDGQTSWEGVRNYQARNLLRDEIHSDDRVLFFTGLDCPACDTVLGKLLQRLDRIDGVLAALDQAGRGVVVDGPQHAIGGRAGNGLRGLILLAHAHTQSPDAAIQ